MSGWGWAWTAEHAVTGVLWSLALAWGVVCCAVLVRTDLREHRLPNRWTLRLAAGGLFGMVGGAFLAGRGDLAVSGVLGGAGYAAAMLVLHVLSRGGLGMGDVKLAVGLGLYAGVAGPAIVVAAGLGAIMLGGLSAALLVVMRRARGSTALPFGPAMVVAVAVALAVA